MSASHLIVVLPDVCLLVARQYVSYFHHHNVIHKDCSSDKPENAMQKNCIIE